MLTSREAESERGKIRTATPVSTYAEQLVREIKETPEEYLPFLLEIIRLFRASITLKPAETSFRQGWKETLAGETRPVSDLWEGIDAE